MEDQFCLKSALSQPIDRFTDGKCLLFKKIADVMGLVFSPSAEQAFSNNPEVYEFQKPFDETDLYHFSLCVKQMNIAQHSQVRNIVVYAIH
jgi:hypothetical protein